MTNVNGLTGILRSNVGDPNQKVHVHSEPNTNSNTIIHNATPGDRVTVLSSITEPDGVWYEVQDVQNPNITGWVRYDVIDLESQSNPPSSSGLTSTLTVKVDTYFKEEPIDSSQLDGSAKVQVKKGTTFELSAWKTVSEHYYITLASPTLLMNRNSWYVYKPDVSIT